MGSRPETKTPGRGPGDPLLRTSASALQSMDTATELRLIEEQLAASWVAGDHKYHERILAEDWSVIDPTGNILTKADVLREAFSGERKITSGKIVAQSNGLVVA